MKEDVIIREYRKEEELEWLDLHASLMVDSYAWWVVIHKKHNYKNEKVDLVAVFEGRLIGLITIEVNAEVIDIVDGNYGFVWEFGVHREYRGNGIGKKLIDKAHDIMKKKFEINRSIWYSQDQNAQRYYEKLGMREIERHWQFTITPTEEQKVQFKKDGFNCWQMRGSCAFGDLEKIKNKYNVIEDDDALKPGLCIGYEYRL